MIFFLGVTNYELIERIGSGGMAEIYLAKAVGASGFEKPVAIKKILPHFSADERFVELLIKEANILSRLRHRNIVQVFDVGKDDEEQYFIVMEYVQGTDMSAIQYDLETRSTKLPVDLSLHIGAEVCEALDHAHRAKDAEGQLLDLVHRDISPSNILLSNSGEVKLTDFGIAKTMGEKNTSEGVRGKFAYIAPEQASNDPVDGRADVFALGIIMFELIIGDRLFSKLQDYEALQAVRAGAVPKPSEADPTLDPQIEEILVRALQASPKDRFQTAGEFGKALRKARYNMPTSDNDPAQEIARLLSNAGYNKDTAFDDADRTVVAYKPKGTVSGFQSLTHLLPEDFDGQMPSHSGKSHGGHTVAFGNNGKPKSPKKSKKSDNVQVSPELQKRASTSVVRGSTEPHSNKLLYSAVILLLAGVITLAAGVISKLASSSKAAAPTIDAQAAPDEDELELPVDKINVGRK